MILGVVLFSTRVRDDSRNEFWEARLNQLAVDPDWVL